MILSILSMNDRILWVLVTDLKKNQTNFWNKNDMKTLITNGLNYWKYSVVLDNLEI